MTHLISLLAEADPAVGSFGWVITAVLTALTGALSFVVRWLLYTHLPAKDAQFMAMSADRIREQKELLEKFNENLEKERSARHTATTVFQDAMNRLAAEHVRDAETARDSFLARQERLENLWRTESEALRGAVDAVRRTIEKCFERLKAVEERQTTVWEFLCRRMDAEAVRKGVASPSPVGGTP